jgi:hypothetical protein
MALDPFDTRVLVNSVNSTEIIEPLGFLKDMFFKNVEVSTTSRVDFDVKVAPRTLATFTDPNIEATLVEKIGFSAKSYRPPYIKEKWTIDPSIFLERRFGTHIYMPTSAQGQNRIQYEIGKIISEGLQRFTNKCEWMCAEVLTTGVVNVVGNGVNTTIDFEMPPAHLLDTTDLTGSVGWDNALSSPLTDFILVDNLIQQGYSGRKIDVAVLGIDAANTFMNHSEIKGDDSIFDNRRVDLGMIQPRKMADGVVYLGHLRDPDIDLYKYTGYYTDTNGVSQTVMPRDKVIVGSTQTMNAMAYGAIYDIDKGTNQSEYSPNSGTLFVGKYFAKSWIKEDPSLRFFMMQTAPLSVLKEPHAFATMTVL